MAQVTGNLESQRRQYDLAAAAAAAGSASVTVIDDDLGRSGSGSMERPGFERLGHTSRRNRSDRSLWLPTVAAASPLSVERYCPNTSMIISCSLR
ncbi:hypothetical protein [Sinorhizobium medicae]